MATPVVAGGRHFAAQAAAGRTDVVAGFERQQEVSSGVEPEH